MWTYNKVICECILNERKSSSTSCSLISKWLIDLARPFILCNNFIHPCGWIWIWGINLKKKTLKICREFEIWLVSCEEFVIYPQSHIAQHNRCYFRLKGLWIVYFSLDYSTNHEHLDLRGRVSQLTSNWVDIIVIVKAADVKHWCYLLGSDTASHCMIHSLRRSRNPSRPRCTFWTQYKTRRC